MGSRDCDEVLISGNDKASCSDTTVEIKIKTLDSHTYTLRVDKYVPVPMLKEQIATVTGVVSEQQRLICRGRVLKDDQLLSAYHVEDGHTLHLVVRQQIPSASSNFADHPATNPVSTNSHGQSAPTVVFGTLDISDLGDGSIPDLTQIFSAIMSSLGMSNVGNGSPSERLSMGSSGNFADSRRQQSELGRERVQSSPENNNFLSFPLAGASEHSQPPALPDSLSTLTEYLNRLRQEFCSTVRGQNGSSESAGSHVSCEPESNNASRSTAGLNGQPDSVSLAAVLHSTRQLLVEQVADFLFQFTNQIQDQANGTGSLTQMSYLSNPRRSGLLMHQVGALLLELGRTIMTLRMGQTEGDHVVNAGPALFISSSGPNPITVRRDHIQRQISFVARPIGPGFPARNPSTDIHSGSVPVGASGSPTRMDSVSGVPGNPLSREPEIWAMPIRTVIAPVPSSTRWPSELPLQARVQGTGLGGNSNGSRESPSPDENNIIDSERHTILQYPERRQDNGSLPSGDHSSEGIPNVQHISAEIAHDVVIQNVATSITTEHAQTSEMDSITQVTDNAFDEGTFLSNLLRQVIPAISQNTASGSTVIDPEDAAVSGARIEQALLIQTEERSTAGRTPRRCSTPPSPPNSKRQKKE